MIELASYAEASSNWSNYPVNLGVVADLSEADIVVAVLISPNYGSPEDGPRVWTFDNAARAPFFSTQHTATDSAMIIVSGFDNFPKQRNVMVRYTVPVFSGPISLVVYGLRNARPQMRRLGDSGARTVGTAEADGTAAYDVGVALSWSATYFYPQNYGVDPVVATGTPLPEVLHALWEPRDYIHVGALQRTQAGDAVSITHAGGVAAITALSVEVRAKAPPIRPAVTREGAIAALVARLTTGLSLRNPAPLVQRNTTIPQALPAGGLVVIRDGETANQITMMSPLSYAIEHAAEIEIVARGATPAASQALLDALLAQAADAVVNDRTLGGAVEFAEVGLPTFDDVTFEGAAPARSASFTVSLFFTVAASPLS